MKICVSNQDYNKIVKVFNQFEIDLPSIIKEDEEDINLEIGNQCININLSNIDNLSNEIKTYFLKFGDSLIDIKDWYKKINQYVYTELDEMEGTLFLMLLAITSSRTSVESNTIIAMKVLGDLLDDIKYRKPQLKRFIEEYGGGTDIKQMTPYFSSLKFYSYIVNDKLSYGKSTLINLIKIVRFIVNNNFNISKTDAINFLLKNYDLDRKKFDANSIKSYKIHKYTINLIDPNFEIVGQEKSHLFSVIDRHMIRYFLPISRDKDLDKFSGMVFSNRKGLYYILIDFLKKIQNKLNSEGIDLKPNELQAIIWYIAIEKYGKDKTDYKSYIDVIKRLNEILIEINDQQENEELTIKKMISLIKGKEKLIMKKKNFPSKEEKKQMSIKFGIKEKNLGENKLNLKSRANDQLLQSVEYYKKKIENNEFPSIKLEVFKLLSDDIKKKYIILSLKNYKPLEESFIKELSDELKNFYDYKMGTYANFFARDIIYDNEISLNEIKDWHLKFFRYLNEEQIKIIITKVINSDEEILEPLIEFVSEYKELLYEEDYIKFLNKEYKQFWWSDEEEELIKYYDKLSEYAKTFLLGRLIQSSQIDRLPIEKYIEDWGIIGLKDKYDFLDYMVENENSEFFENNPNLIIGNIMDKIIEYDIIEDKENLYRNMDDNQKKYWIQKRLEDFGYDELEDWEQQIAGLYPKYKNLQQKIKTTGEFLTDEEFKDLTNKQKQMYLQRLKNDGEELTDWEKRYLGENVETKDKLEKILINKLNNFIIENPISNYNKIESVFYNTSARWEISIKFEGGLEDYFTIKPFGIGNIQFKNLDINSKKSLIGVLQRICKIIDLEFSKLIPVLEKEYKIHLRLNEGKKINESISTDKVILELFQTNSELSNIGTSEQYNEYLKTIFPNSKVKDIVYHSSPNKFGKFEVRHFGIYFSYSPLNYSYGENIYKCLIDVKNPLVMPKSSDSPETKELYSKEYRNYVHNNKYDASIETSTVTAEGTQIRVKSPEQIHILGSKEDIEGFKNFVKNNVMEGINFKSRASEQEKQRDKYFNNIFTKDINQITKEDISFVMTFLKNIQDDSVGNLTKKFEEKIINPIIDLLPNPESEWDDYFNEIKITFSNKNCPFCEIELSKLTLSKIYVTNNINTFKKTFKSLGELISYLKEEILKQNTMEGIKLKNTTLNESRTIISEDVRYHIENGLSLNQNVFRIGSESYYSLINECRTLYKKDVIELNESDKELIESDLGKSVNTTHGWVYLDSPFLLEETDETLETWGRMCEAEYKGRKVSLNKPFRSSSGGKKYGVYVKNPESGNVKLIRFGDSNMRVGTMNKERVKSFVARHRCHEKKDKTKAGYWACRLPQYGLVKYKGRFW